MPFPGSVDATRGRHERKIAWGDIYWFHFGTAGSHQYTFAGPHPCVVLSDVATVIPGTVVIAPLTSAHHGRSGYAYHVPVGKSDCVGLDNDSVVKADQLYCVDSADLIDEYYVGTLGAAVMKRIYLQLANALNFRRALTGS